MANFTSVNTTAFHLPLPPSRGQLMGGPSVVGSGATLGRIVEPSNRRKRREQDRQARKARPTLEGRDKPTKEEARQQLVSHIKKDLEKKGVTLPASAETSDEPAPDSFASWSVQALQTGATTIFKTLHDVIQWTPGPMLARAASTCDVNGQCGVEADAEVPPISIEDFRKSARADFSITMSHSLKAREDQTLRGVVVLIGEADHDQPNYHSNWERASTRLVQSSIRRGDLLLVEQPAIEGWTGACKGVLDRGVKCYPIDVSEARAELDKAEDEMKRAMARVTLATMEVVDQGGQRMPSVEELASLDRDELTELMLHSMTELRAAGGESLFSPEGWSHFKTLHEAYTAAGKKLEVKIVETIPAREEGLGGELERHSAAAPDRAVFVVLGDLHVENMAAWVLEHWPAIVLHPKHQ